MLAEQGYIWDVLTPSTIYLAAVLQKPVLVENFAGTGKIQLSEAAAPSSGARRIR